MFDVSTPREVFEEYAARKARLLLTLTPFAYERAIAAIADDLGLGVAPDELTPLQRARQQHAIREWGSACEP